MPVRLGPRGHWFGADGEIVDYAVRMRRLADEHSADALIRHKALTPDHVTRLAARLAEFFHKATSTPEAGAVEAIRENVIENFTQVERFVGRFMSRASVVLDSGRGVVLDATFRERALRLRARDLARRHGQPFLFVETVCDEATLRQRLRHRASGPSISDAGEALLDRVRAELEPVT